MISHYLREVRLNRETLSIFERRVSSKFRKYQVQIKYIVTNNEKEAFLHPSYLLRNKGIQQILIWRSETSASFQTCILTSISLET